MATEYATWPRASKDELANWAKTRGDDVGRAARAYMDLIDIALASREAPPAAQDDAELVARVAMTTDELAAQLCRSVHPCWSIVSEIMSDKNDFDPDTGIPTQAGQYREFARIALRALGGRT